MKPLLSLAILASLVGCNLPAQMSTPAPYPYSGQAQTAVSQAGFFAPEQLDALLGPIALYPDALIALILPASTNPSDIVLAARYLQAGGDPAQADAQPWEDSVRGLVHFPQVVRWMDENLAWTKQLGDAFRGQPQDVMDTVQRLRARARAAGTLVDTPQQQVVYQDSAILIVPTQPDTIYVPYYDPSVVYLPSRSFYYQPDPFFGFSSGFAAGWWMSYGLDWGHRRVWTIDRSERERYWREHRGDWHRRPGYGYRDGAPGTRTWQPQPGPRPSSRFAPGHTAQVARPTPSNRWQDYSRDEGRRNDSRRATTRRDPAEIGRETASRSPVFVGPTALRAPLPQPLPVPPAVPPLRAADPTPPSDAHRYKRGANRSERAPTYYSPRPDAPLAGPMPAPVHQNQGYTHPAAAAPAPRPAPALRYTPPAPPPPAAQPQPAPAPPPSQNSSGDDDNRRRPPYIRPR